MALLYVLQLLRTDGKLEGYPAAVPYDTIPRPEVLPQLVDGGARF